MYKILEKSKKFSLWRYTDYVIKVNFTENSTATNGSVKRVSFFFKVMTLLIAKKELGKHNNTAKLQKTKQRKGRTKPKTKSRLPEVFLEKVFLKALENSQ